MLYSFVSFVSFVSKLYLVYPDRTLNPIPLVRIVAFIVVYSFVSFVSFVSKLYVL